MPDHPSRTDIELELSQIAARWDEPVPEVDLLQLVELKRREQGLAIEKPADSCPGTT